MPNSSRSISQCTDSVLSQQRARYAMLYQMHSKYSFSQFSSFSLRSQQVEMKTSNMFILSVFFAYSVSVCWSHRQQTVRRRRMKKTRKKMCMMIGCMHWLAAIRNRYRRNKERGREREQKEWITKKTRSLAGAHIRNS